MAVPKQKQSHSRTAHRRSNHKAKVPALVPVVVDGIEYRVPRRLVPAVKRGLIHPPGGRKSRAADPAGGER